MKWFHSVITKRKHNTYMYMYITHATHLSAPPLFRVPTALYNNELAPMLAVFIVGRFFGALGAQ